jgi:hypothetical protein
VRLHKNSKTETKTGGEKERERESRKYTNERGKQLW